LRIKHKVRRRKGGTYPLSHLYGYFGLVRLTALEHDVPWVKA
jgi:RNA-directed DNA polymerase